MLQEGGREEFDFAVVASGLYSHVLNMPDWADKALQPQCGFPNLGGTFLASYNKELWNFGFILRSSYFRRLR